MIRYDTVPIHAQKTDEGFIRDKPVIGRTGSLYIAMRMARRGGSTGRRKKPLIKTVWLA